MQSPTERILASARSGSTASQRQAVEEITRAIQRKDWGVERDSRDHRCLSHAIQDESLSRSIHRRLERILCRRVTSKDEESIEPGTQASGHEVERRRNIA